jgi:hypothetical protein
MIFIEWKSTGSLLWIHGKRAFQSSVLGRAPSDRLHYHSGLWEKRHLVCCSSPPSCRNLFVRQFLCRPRHYGRMRMLDPPSWPTFTSISGIPTRKPVTTCCFLSYFQLSTRSSPCCDILHRVYRTHENGTRQPSDDTLKECLKEMLRLPAQGPIFIILDALDECPDSSGIPSPRHEVLQLVKELVDLHLQDLHICATSRPEVNIRAFLEPLAFRSVSLHDESGQKGDIVDYVRSVVNSSPSTAMRRWRADDKNLVIETLTERADGM